MKRNNSAANVKTFTDSSKLVRDLVSKAKISFQSKLCNSLSENSCGTKNYWHILKQLLGKKFATGFLRSIYI